MSRSLFDSFHLPRQEKNGSNVEKSRNLFDDFGTSRQEEKGSNQNMAKSLFRNKNLLHPFQNLPQRLGNLKVRLQRYQTEMPPGEPFQRAAKAIKHVEKMIEEIGISKLGLNLYFDKHVIAFKYEALWAPEIHKAGLKIQEESIGRSFLALAKQGPPEGKPRTNKFGVKGRNNKPLVFRRNDPRAWRKLKCTLSEIGHELEDIRKKVPLYQFAGLHRETVEFPNMLARITLVQEELVRCYDEMEACYSLLFFPTHAISKHRTLHLELTEMKSKYPQATGQGANCN